MYSLEQYLSIAPLRVVLTVANWNLRCGRHAKTFRSCRKSANFLSCGAHFSTIWARRATKVGPSLQSFRQQGRTHGDERRPARRGFPPHYQEVSMDLSVQLNMLAAALSFGFVAAVVLGMV